MASNHNSQIYSAFKTKHNFLLFIFIFLGIIIISTSKTLSFKFTNTLDITAKEQCFNVYFYIFKKTYHGTGKKSRPGALNVWTSSSVNLVQAFSKAHFVLLENNLHWLQLLFCISAFLLCISTLKKWILDATSHQEKAGNVS